MAPKPWLQPRGRLPWWPVSPLDGPASPAGPSRGDESPRGGEGTSPSYWPQSMCVLGRGQRTERLREVFLVLVLRLREVKPASGVRSQPAPGTAPPIFRSTTGGSPSRLVQAGKRQPRLLGYSWCPLTGKQWPGWGSRRLGATTLGAGRGLRPEGVRPLPEQRLEPQPALPGERLLAGGQPTMPFNSLTPPRCSQTTLAGAVETGQL